ncbi:hypothetical protein JKF63_04663 [Porcisia hertigi]|uniref:ER-Golgi trafficking TRAPP I complex 85 kDa subunit family protein n=1 Tax=Porcisia hertigi TaxID=2761500 RepID=A0A836ICY2_9TRYP|nr:hypothetical protein JKF63_04663 [Porcisia hertigi]
MSLEDWVVQRYARPVVVVESSSATNAICARNGVDLIHLLRLHSVYAGGPLHAHTGDRSEPTVCHKFGVRLMRTECVLEVGLSQLTKHTRRMLRDAVVMDLAYGEKFDAALEEIVEKSRSRHDGSLPRPVRPAQACTSSSPSSTPSKWIGGPAAVSTLLERSCPPWHHTFIHDFHNLVRCSSFDTIDYPVGAIFAVATSEAGGIEGILKAFRVQAQRIQELRASLPGMDTELHYYYLILHDNTSPLSPSLSTARQLLAAVQQRYGANYCALIKLNSVVDPRTVKNLDPSMWIEASPKVMDVPSARALHQAAAAASSAAAATPRSPNASTTSLSSSAVPPNGDVIGRTPALSFRTVQSTFGTWPNSNTAIITGCYMSPEDVTEVHNVMAYYLSQSLFRFIEQRLRMLDLSVQDRRTTTLGKMAAWFKGKDEGRPRSADVVNVPNSFDSSLRPMYVAHSLEMQMRHCGDLSLALHDLKGAASYYRMCIDELLETLALRPFNRAFIAACQEGIGVAQLLQGKLAPQSLTPWYTGVMSTMQRVSSQANRWEVASNDYLAAGMPVHAMRVAFLLYENSRLHTPPMLDRCQAILTHLQRSGILRQHNLINGIVNDMLAGMAVFTNPPFPAGLAVSPSIPRDYPIYMSLRRFAQRLQQAGALYRTENLPEQALRCYLRVLKLFRVIDPQETWKTLTEHLYLTAGQLYAQLGQDVRGIAMISAAVAQGTPLYRNPATAQQAFEAFWAQQKGVLSRISYTLCPHMTMPRILRGSFHIDSNLFSTDMLTDDATRKMGEAAAKREWRSMEKHLQNYTKKSLGVHPHYHLSILQGADKDSIGGSSHGGPRHTANNGHRHSPTADAHAHGEASSRALSRQTGLRQNEFGPAVEETTSGVAPQALRRYTIAKAEPLVLSFIMENPIGCSIEVTELTLLYLACTSPEQLWKSSATQTVRLKAGACQRVSLSFDPVTEGEYAIIGFCWCLLGQEGYYYFATRESRPGCPESTYEYAIEHPSPSLDAPENIYVSVTPSKARVTATFRPPLPEHLYDGEYFHTSLVLHNTSAQQDAAHVVLQRHPAASHLMYLEEFGRLQNLDRETPLVLAEHLKAQETRTFAVTIRAQHRRGDAALQNTINYFFLLLGYLPGPLTAPERLEPSPSASAMELDTTGLTALTGSSPVSTLTTPTSAQPHSPTAAFWTYKTSGGPAVAVRLHRLLRQCEVQPVVAMYSTVLPPANASLRTAVVLTVKNICTVVASTPSSETATTPPSVANVVHNVPHSSDGNELSSRHPHGKIPSYTPVRVARVLAVHSPRWGVECEGTEDLFADCAMHCLLSQGDSLTLPLLVKRQQHAAKEADTTLQGMDRSNAASGAQCPYSDTTCIALVNALPSPARAKAVEEQLGTSVSQSERNLFFLQTSCLGPGDVGANSSPQRAGGSLAFYADKAGQQKVKLKTAQQRRCDEIGEERRLCGGPIEQYTPLAIAVTWVREEGGVGVDSQKQRSGGGGVKLRKGQVFLFVDPIEHVYQTLAQQQQRHAEQETAASLRPVLSTVGAARVSVVQSQQELCEAMLVRHTSLKPWQGALVSHVHVPPVMRVAKGQTLDKTVAAQIPVTLRCLSLAPVPLLVTAEALPPSVPHSSLSSLGPARIGGAGGDQHGSPAMPQPLPSPSVSAIRRPDASVLFVGKTTHTFLLMPSEEYEVKFTALPLRPGLVDCQRISLSAASICFLHSTAAKRGDDDGGTENMRCAASVPSTSQEGGGNTATAAQPLMRTGMTLPALIRALRSCGTPSTAANPTRGTSHSARQLWGRERSDADADADERRTAEWPRSQRTSQGYPVVAGHDTMLTLVERYGARAAELVHQLAPLGPAGGATVSQVIPSTAPALTHVIIVDDEVSTRPTTGDGAGVAVQKEASPAMTHSRNAARKFFRQLECFEMELEKASRRNPSDPFALQYIYRPTVKMAEGDASKAGYYTTNSSLATSKSLTSATGITGNAEAPLRNTSWNSPSTPAAVPSLTTDTTSMISGGGTTTSGLSHKANHPAQAVAETSIGAQETSPSALSLSHQPLDAVTEELPSPLHLPAVAFECRAADTALTFDVGEMKTAL